MTETEGRGIREGMNERIKEGRQMNVRSKEIGYREGKEGERQEERQRDKDVGRQRGRETERQRVIEAWRQRDREAEGGGRRQGGRHNARRQGDMQELDAGNQDPPSVAAGFY